MNPRSTHVQVAGNVHVVDPNILRSLNGDGITIFRKNLGNLHVSNNDVRLLVDGEADASEAWSSQSWYSETHIFRRCKPTGAGRANDGLVGSHSHFGSARDGAFQDNDSRSVSFSGRREGSEA